MSTALTGPAADLEDNMEAGVLAGFHRANKDGGIHRRPLRLIALDDGYEPSRTTPNIRKLIEQERVLGIIGNVGTPKIEFPPFHPLLLTFYFSLLTNFRHPSESSHNKLVPVLCMKNVRDLSSSFW